MKLSIKPSQVKLLKRVGVLFGIWLFFASLFIPLHSAKEYYDLRDYYQRQCDATCYPSVSVFKFKASKVCTCSIDQFQKEIHLEGN